MTLVAPPPGPAEAAAIDVFEAYFEPDSNPRDCNNFQGWPDGRLMGSVSISTLSYSEGDAVTATLVLGPSPSKSTFAGVVNSSFGGPQEVVRLGGQTRVSLFWPETVHWPRAERVISHSGGNGGTVRVIGTGVEWYPTSSFNADGDFVSNNLFSPGDTFSITFKAPPQNPSGQLPSANLSGTEWTDLETGEGLYGRFGCHLINRSNPAACAATQSGPGGSVITFTDETPGGIGRTWTFPDGSTSTDESVVKTATSPGDYVAQLSATTSTGGGATDCTVEVKPPSLTGSLQLLHDDASNTTGKFEFGEEFTVRLRVGADDDGVGDLTTTLDTTDSFLAASELEILSGPAPEIVSPDVIPPGQLRTYEWRVRAAEYGKFTVRADATATDSNGDAVDPFTPERNGRIGGLLDVDLTFDPTELNLVENIDDGTGQPEPAPVRVTMKVTNPTDQTATEVVLPDTLDIIDVDNPRTTLPRLVNVSGPWPSGSDPGPVDVGPFDMAPGEIRAVDYLLEGRDDGKFDVRAGVRLSSGGDPVLEIGTERFTIGAGALLGVRLRNNLADDGFVRGGNGVTMTGHLENLSTTETIEVDLATFDPALTGNASAVSIREDTVILPPNNCGLVAPVLTLAPGERTLIHGAVISHPDGGTRSTVAYPTPDGVVLRGGDAGTPPTKVALTGDDILVTSDSELEYQYSVDVSVPLKEWNTLLAAAGLTFGLIDGGKEWVVTGLTGIASLLKEIGTWENWASLAEHGPDVMLKAALWYVENWKFRTPGEKATYVAELARDYYDSLIEAGMKTTLAEKQRTLAEAVLPGWFDQVERAYATNDPFAIGQAWGRAGGNVAAELVSCIPFSAKYAGKFVTIAQAKKVDQAAAVARSTRLAEAGSEAAKLQTIRRGIENGSEITANASIMWGLGHQAFDAIQRYAAKNKLLITLRDRTPGSVARLAEGFLEKFEYMKLKSVRPDVDRPLGYLPDHDDIVAFKKPISQSELDGVLAATPDATLRSEIASRHAKRSAEWDEWFDTYESWKTSGFPAGFRHRPNGGSAANGGSKLPFRLAEVEVDGRVLEDYFIPEVFVDGKWRGFTGDIDIVDIRRVDGQGVSPSEASKVYKDLNKLADVNLRHGDTIHWISDPVLTPNQVFDIKLGQLADFFLGGPDKALQIGPDIGRAVQLDPEKSFLLRKATGGVAGRTTYATWDGGVNHWTQNWAGIGILEIDFTYSAANLPMFLAPASWVTNGCTVTMDRSEGSIVRSSETGPQLETYVDGAWTSRPLDSCAEPTPVGDAQDLLEVTELSATRLPILPQSGLSVGIDAGETVIPIHDLPSIEGSGHVGDWFEVGDVVIIDPGTDVEERRTIVDLATMTIDRPLEFVHRRNAIVTLAAAVPLVASLYPITPVRAFETRTGQATIDGEFEGIGRLAAGSVTPVKIGGRGGVSEGAVAVALNVTAIRPSAGGYVTLFPCGEERPTTSSLNHGAGGVAGNSGVVALSTGGELCVFAFADTDLVIDVTGWLADVPDFSPLVAARLVETRSGESTIDGESNSLGRLAAASTTRVKIAGRGGVGSDADAVALNVTAIRPSGVGYVTLFPCDGAQPVTSSLNFGPGDVKGNSAVVALSGDGELCVYASAETDLVLDVTAAFSTDGSFGALVPGRILETRAGESTIDGVAEGSERVAAGKMIDVDVAGRANVPAGATAVAVNVTAIRPSGIGYVTLFPCDGAQPLTSSLNYSTGGVAGNSAIVKLAVDGSLCAYSQAEADLVIDVTAAWV